MASICKGCVGPGLVGLCCQLTFSFLCVFLAVCLTEAEKLNKMSTLLERLHAKYNQNRPWTETMKLVRQVMVRSAGL